MFNKLKQIKDLREQAKSLQNNLSQEHVEGVGGWGKIKVTMDGNQQITGVSVDPEFLSPDKKEKLEKGIAEAFADCLKKIQKIMVSKMKEGNISLPDFK